MNWTDEIIAAFIGLLGALAGAWAAWWSGVHASRWSRTLDMHREFNSEQLSEARSRAYAFIKANWGLAFNEIAERFGLESMPLWDVMRFYHCLAVAVTHKQVIRRVVPDLFGEVFVWWYIICFRQQLLETEWIAAKDIKALYEWMGKKADRAKWKEWTHNAERNLKQLRAVYASSVQQPKGT